MGTICKITKVKTLQQTINRKTDEIFQLEDEIDTLRAKAGRGSRITRETWVYSQYSSLQTKVYRGRRSLHNYQ